MPGITNIVVQKLSGITLVTIQNARLLESSELASMGLELTRVVDQDDCGKLVLDFSKVQFLASAGIGVITTVHAKCKATGCAMILCGVRREMMKVFEIMGLLKVLRFAPDQAEALKQFGYTPAR